MHCTNKDTLSRLSISYFGKETVIALRERFNHEKYENLFDIEQHHASKFVSLNTIIYRM